jgi:hypothetical protein
MLDRSRDASLRRPLSPNHLGWFGHRTGPGVPRQVPDTYETAHGLIEILLSHVLSRTCLCPGYRTACPTQRRRFTRRDGGTDEERRRLGGEVVFHHDQVDRVERQHRGGHSWRLDHKS